MGAHEFEGAFAEHLIHDTLEARGMIEAGLFLDVNEDIQRRTGEGDEIFRTPGVAKAGNGLEADLKSEPFGSWFCDTTPKFDDIFFVCAEPLDEFVRLFGRKGVEERVSALLFFE